MIIKNSITNWLKTNFKAKAKAKESTNSSELGLQTNLNWRPDIELEGIETREALNENAKRFKILFESANDAIFMMHGPYFTDCNSATERIFGCSKDQIIGQTPLHFSPEIQPSGIPSEEAAMEKIENAQSGELQFFEWRHKKYDGTPFDAEVSLNSFEVDSQVYVQAIVRDITERKQKAAENHLLAMVANTTNNIVIIADPEGRVEWVNDTFTAITGYSFEEIVGKRPGSYYKGRKQTLIREPILLNNCPS